MNKEEDIEKEEKKRRKREHKHAERRRACIMKYHCTTLLSRQYNI